MELPIIKSVVVEASKEHQLPDQVIRHILARLDQAAMECGEVTRSGRGATFGCPAEERFYKEQLWGG